MGLDALICDLDGVVTDTASVHAASWKDLFDGYLKDRAARDGGPFIPFSLAEDYISLVDGKPRSDGVDSFLRSRGIVLPWGAPGDSAEAETVCGLGNRKNTLFRAALGRDGVTVFDGAVGVIRAFKQAGGRVAVVSSSKNCGPVLDRAGLSDLFEAMVDGLRAAEEKLPGKPAPDTFLRGAALLGVAPEASCVVEDAVSGVAAGAAGGFRLVVGVDRGAGEEALRAAGAHYVVSDLGEFLP
jgi:beta-phosphoglucomutase family hydrolase